MTMSQKREPMRQRAFLNGWGKTRLKERRIDRARREAALQREVAADPSQAVFTCFVTGRNCHLQGIRVNAQTCGDKICDLEL